MAFTFNWYQIIKYSHLVSKLQNVYNWYHDLQYTYIFQLISKTYNVSFSLVSKVYKIFSINIFWYLKKFYLFSIGLIIWYQMFWYVLLICKGSLTSSLYIDSCWVYLILKSLTALLYVLHVCRRSFTFSFIHCILCIMWLGSSHLFSYKCMYVGGLTPRLSSSWMHIAYTLYCFDLCF